MGLAILVEGLVTIALAIGIAFIVGGLGNGTQNVGVRNLIFQQIPPAHVGSAWAYYRMLTSASIAVGYLVGTPRTPADAQGLVVIAGICALAGVMISIVVLRLRGSKPGSRASVAPKFDRDSSTPGSR